MKSFIKRFLIFTIPIILVCGMLLIYLDIYIKTNFEKFTFKTNFNKIAVGDSRVQTTINDSLIINLRNIAQSSESYIYSFYKIKTITKNNLKIDTIFLGASYHSFSDYYDDIIYNHYVMATYFYILPIDVKYELLKKVDNPLSFLFKSILSWAETLISKSGINKLLGSYSNPVTNVTINESSLKYRIREQYFHNAQLRNFSISNINYFNLIVSYCNENNISLIILNTPMYSEYKEKVPKKFRDKYYSLITENHLKLVEFDGLVLGKEDFLPDGDHLSEKGAILATKYLKEYIKFDAPSMQITNKGK